VVLVLWSFVTHVCVGWPYCNGDGDIDLGSWWICCFPTFVTMFVVLVVKQCFFDVVVVNVDEILVVPWWLVHGEEVGDWRCWHGRLWLVTFVSIRIKNIFSMSLIH